MTTQPDVVRTSRLTRIFYIDNLRVFLTVLVVVHPSAALTAISTSGPIGNSLLRRPRLLLVNQTFFMGFFLLSGYFVPGAADRKGPGKFAVERLKRLVIPCRWFETVPRRSGWIGVLLVVVSFVPMALGGYRGFGVSGALASHDLAHPALWEFWVISGALRRVPAVRAVV